MKIRDCSRGLDEMAVWMDRRGGRWKVKSVALSDSFECGEIERGRNLGKLLDFLFEYVGKVMGLFKG